MNTTKEYEALIAQSIFSPNNEDQGKTFNVYLCGENHEESTYKKNLIIDTSINAEVNYYLLLEGLFYGELMNSHAQGIEYPPAKWLGQFLSMYITISKLKLYCNLPSDNTILPWDNKALQEAVAVFFTKVRFFFKTHNKENSYSWDFLTQLDNAYPTLKVVAEYCIKKGKLSDEEDFKETAPDSVYGSDLEYFKKHFILFFQLASCIMHYLSRDPSIVGFHEQTLNNQNIKVLMDKCIQGVSEIPAQYTAEYYENQQEIHNNALILAFLIRETYIVANLRDFLEKNQPCKDVILILGDGHIQNIEKYHKVFLESPIHGVFKYAFSFWPLSRIEIDGEPIALGQRNSNCQQM